MQFQINVPAGYQVQDSHNDNMDINVILDSGEVYSCTIFTLENIRMLMSNVKPPARYFWAADMVIVDTMSVDCIKDAVRQLIADGYLEFASTNIGRVEDVYGVPPIMRNLL
jgi:hypothetical protein